MKKLLKTFFSLITAGTIALSCFGTAFAAGVDDYSGEKIGVVTGAIFDEVVQKRLPNAEVVYFNSISDAALALKQDKITGIATDKPIADSIAKEYGGFSVLRELLAPDDYAFGFPKTQRGELLKKQMDEFLEKLSASGELKHCEEKWISGEGSNVDLPQEGANGTLEVVSDSTNPPFVHLTDGKIAGFVVELTALFCREYGYVPRFTEMNLASLVPSVAAGKADMIAMPLSVTPERAESILFSSPYYNGGVALVVNDGAAALGCLEDFAHKRVGIKEGSIYEAIAKEYLPEAQRLEYKNTPDLVMALTEGKIDCFFANLGAGKAIIAQNSGIYIVGGEKIRAEKYCFVFPKSDDADNLALMAQFNDFLKQSGEDGTLKALDELWLGNDESAKVVDLNSFSGENGKLTMAANTGQEPFCYVKDGKYVGYDIDLAARFCRAYGYSLEISDMNFGSIVPSVATKKCDFGMALSETEERKESIYFSDMTYDNGVVLLAYNSSLAEKKGFFEQIAESFDKTFIRENRWQLILQGIGTTLVISVLAALAGTVLGFGVCMLRRSKNKLLSGIASAYIRLLQGTPIVVFLMIMYYVVFGKSDLDPLWVAVIGFAMNFAAYSSEIMRTGLDAVDKGQTEAATALGFTPLQTFTMVILPQAAKHFLPVYRGEIISLVKSTSIVGYIAVQDLTKVSDIIRSRTYEAFFPLIATAVIYFVLAWLLSLGLNLLMKRLDPANAKRTVKGVTLK